MSHHIVLHLEPLVSMRKVAFSIPHILFSMYFSSFPLRVHVDKVSLYKHSGIWFMYVAAEMLEVLGTAAV